MYTLIYIKLLGNTSFLSTYVGVIYIEPSLLSPKGLFLLDFSGVVLVVHCCSSWVSGCKLDSRCGQEDSCCAARKQAQPTRMALDSPNRTRAGTHTQTHTHTHAPHLTSPPHVITYIWIRVYRNRWKDRNRWNIEIVERSESLKGSKSLKDRKHWKIWNRWKIEIFARIGIVERSKWLKDQNRRKDRNRWRIGIVERLKSLKDRSLWKDRTRWTIDTISRPSLLNVFVNPEGFLYLLTGFAAHVAGRAQSPTQYSLVDPNNPPTHCWVIKGWEDGEWFEANPPIADKTEADNLCASMRAHEWAAKFNFTVWLRPLPRSYWGVIMRSFLNQRLISRPCLPDMFCFQFLF